MCGLVLPKAFPGNVVTKGNTKKYNRNLKVLFDFIHKKVDYYSLLTKKAYMQQNGFI